uniref:hypothetical protein n=1 Tax=uncultured Faecalibaculum sp. TaxID=1729681 RepID=UPI00272E6100
KDTGRHEESGEAVRTSQEKARNNQRKHLISLEQMDPGMIQKNHPLFLEVKDRRHVDVWRSFGLTETEPQASSSKKTLPP